MTQISETTMKGMLLDMLSSIHEYCEDNKITYSLGGGTLLGAIRHNGYIPWDDDLDIMMPRPDYEKFIRDFNKHNERYQFIYATDNDSVSCAHCFGKVHDTHTCVIEKTSPQNVSGIYIDIFPIDGMPQNSLVCNLFLWIQKQLGLFMYYQNCRFCDIRSYGARIRKLVGSIFSLSTWGRIINKSYSLIPFSTAKYAGAISGVYGIRERYKKEVFDSYEMHAFENRCYYVISDYNIYLQQHYGQNYMQIPSVDRRINHRNEAYLLD